MCWAVQAGSKPLSWNPAASFQTCDGVAICHETVGVVNQLLNHSSCKLEEGYIAKRAAIHFSEATKSKPISPLEFECPRISETFLVLSLSEYCQILRRIFKNLYIRSCHAVSSSPVRFYISSFLAPLIRASHRHPTTPFLQRTNGYRVSCI